MFTNRLPALRESVSIESLEPRIVFDSAAIVSNVLVVLGDPVDNDLLTISRDGDDVLVQFDDIPDQTFDANDFDAISMRGDTGADFLTLIGNIKIPTEIRGQGGSDTINTNNTLALVLGGSGDDDIKGRGILNGGSGADSIVGGGGRQFIYGGPGNDSIRGGSGSDIVFAGTGHDTVRGDAGNDIIFGDDGNDLLRGGDGNDKLFGIIGKDTLQGENDNDTLYGGAGADVLDGGSGTNRVKSGEFTGLQDLIDEYEELADTFLD
jgi:Ca2+-binding RTX toxin-like protein